jgi:V/A-type H+-transporting ATPase subunit D
MARLNVNPTRMELRRLKTRLKTATRGHKLLKDKSDEMIRQFSALIKLNKNLRDEVENELNKVLTSFATAKSLVDERVLEEAFLMPSSTVKLKCGIKNIMSVPVPDIEVVSDESDDLFPYNFATLTSEADYSVATLSKLIVKLVKLAEIEKACNMLADEIQKNKRRVNALEYVMIPQIQETIKYITMKLDENERGNLTRLMKVKSMIENR